MKRMLDLIIELAGVALVLLVALPAHAQLMLAHEGHHSGDCAIKNGAFPVAFSAYEKPKGELPPTHAYCDHVPETGELYFSVDLTDLESREIPIAIRLVMEGHGEGGHEIMSIPAKQYPSGSIAFTANLEDLGQYAVLLETEKGGKMTTAVRIPVHVGGGGGHGGHGSGIGATEIALLVGAAGIGAFFWFRRRASPKAS
ncbi:MAG: ORF4 protein [Nitrosospira sp.]